MPLPMSLFVIGRIQYRRCMVAVDSTGFNELAVRMERIRRGEETYGSGGGPVLQATSFYLEHLLPEAVRRARSVSRLPSRKVDLLISVCGFAATPTVLTYELLRPRRLLVLRSQDASESVNLIGRHLLAPDKLDFESFQHETVNPTDPLDRSSAGWTGSPTGSTR